MNEQTDTPTLMAQHIYLSWQQMPSVEHKHTLFSGFKLNDHQKRATCDERVWSSVVVADITMSVKKGELVCLVGRSGCGKTTILHALSGLMKPVMGQVFFHGTDITGRPGHVSYMFQKDLLLEHKRIIDNVCLPLTLRRVAQAEAYGQAQPLFERFGLAGCEYKWPHELSGGMRQRAAFLRTYLMGSDCILLDEPFSALDALTRVAMRNWYCDIAHELGIATLAITHDVDEAATMASRVYVLGHMSKNTQRALQNQQVPTTAHIIVGEVHVPTHDVSMHADAFALTPEFLSCKKEILSLL